jgi:uncharacterized protein YdiU (UPF0061 family)
VSAAFRPEKAILELDDRFHRSVEAAEFPQHALRWRNRRWAAEVGLDALSDQNWIDHFGKFRPLPGSLERPLAQAYHGHQFQVYNPQIGDGRGFLFAQLRDGRGRLLDLGTKGSGQTPWSRSGDGRLTLKGGVREIMAASMLEALGVYTSKPFSLIETGEQLARNDEPSPTRSSVLVRLSHSHMRFGTFQRQAYAGDADAIGRLVEYCIRHYHPNAAAADMATSAAGLLREVVAATAELAASWMSAGFVHGVLNTDNMVVTGESFDYGPWRFLPYSDPSFTAAYFDGTGLYAFGRQPSASLWNLGQLAQCLTLVSEVSLLEKELERYENLYRAAFPKRVLGALGLRALDPEADLELVKVLFAWMGETRARWPQVFFDWFGGAASEQRAARSELSKLYAGAGFEPVRAAVMAHAPERPERLTHDYFQASGPPTLLIEDVEAIWADVADRDDWEAFYRHMARIETARQALSLS